MSGFCPFHYTVFPDDFPQMWGKWCKKATLVCAYQGSGRVGRCMNDHTYVVGDYTDYGYMGSNGVEYVTIDEAIEAGAA